MLLELGYSTDKMRRVVWLLVCLLAAANDRMVMASSAWASAGQLAGGSAGAFGREVVGAASKVR